MQVDEFSSEERRIFFCFVHFCMEGSFAADVPDALAWDFWLACSLTQNKMELSLPLHIFLWMASNALVLSMEFDKSGMSLHKDITCAWCSFNLCLVQIRPRLCRTDSVKDFDAWISLFQSDTMSQSCKDRKTKNRKDVLVYAWVLCVSTALQFISVRVSASTRHWKSE